MCEVGVVEEKRKDLDFKRTGYKFKVIIPNQRVFECPYCNESFQNTEDQKEVERILLSSRKEIDNLFINRHKGRILND